MAEQVETRKTRISVSQIGTFLSCSYKWQLTYQKNLRVRSTDVGPASLGTVVHYGIAAGLREYWERTSQHLITGYWELGSVIHNAINDWDEQNRTEGKTTFGVVDGKPCQVPDLAFYAEWGAMVTNAKALALRTLESLELIENYDVVDTEYFLGVAEELVPLIEFKMVQDVQGTDFEFAGVIDAVLRNRNTGLIEVIDWKVRRSFTGLDAEQLNSQIGIYQHALRTLGVDAAVGVVYQIKNEAPKTPGLNKADKNGVQAMSRQKITTDWPTYKAALIEAGLNPEDYEDMAEKLSDVEWFRPLMVIRTERVTTALWENMVEHARRISEETRFPRSWGYPCQHCHFKEWCQAELYDYDTDELLEERYEIYVRPSDTDEESED